MKKIFQTLLQIGEQAAILTVPGAAAVDAAVRNIASAKTGLEREVAIMQTAITSLQLVEHDLGVSFADEPDFQAGLLQANAGALLMVKAIQARKAANPT